MLFQLTTALTLQRKPQYPYVVFKTEKKIDFSPTLYSLAFFVYKHLVLKDPESIVKPRRMY